ncbi:MAG: STAS domain-containing protein [Nevskia sp.]|nr:STAS domain-containing protein [Nevskia sp.]
MELNATRHNDIVVLTPQGRVDHLNADAFGKAVAPYVEQCHLGGVQLLFDLSHLEYISSAGLRILMLASKRAIPAGGKIGVAAPTPTVREILEISRFDLVFPVFDTVLKGVATLSGAAPKGS